MSVDEYIRLQAVVKFLRENGFGPAGDFLMRHQNDIWKVEV